MRRFSKAALALKGQQMFQVLALAKSLESNGKSVIHFEIGDPDFDTPENVVEACCEALRSGDTHYTVSSGLSEFKQVACKVTERSRGFLPGADQILVTAGGNVQLYYAIACAADPGEEVIITDPSFVSYSSIIEYLGVNARKVGLFESNRFRLDPDDLRKAITNKTRMIVINSPHNPTGSVLTADEVREIYKIAEENDIYLLSDEVYARMTYEDDAVKFVSPSVYDQCRERTILVHSFSKTYAMTGWRIGAVTAPADLIEKMALLLETTSSCVSPFIQRGAIEAMESGPKYIGPMINEFRKRRDLIVEELNDIKGITCIKPDGAFYAFANIRGTGLSDLDFANKMLNESGVACCPGSFFGDYGKGYARFCFANSQDNIREGMRRLKAILGSR